MRDTVVGYAINALLLSEENSASLAGHQAFGNDHYDRVKFDGSVRKRDG
jgi:hypothetical protein